MNIVKDIVKDYTPPVIWRMIKRLMTKNTDKNNKRYFHCPVCNKKVRTFNKLPDFYDDMLEKYEYVHSIYCTETMNRNSYSCPRCNASDRSRLYAVYLKEKFNAFSKEEYTFLDIAPSENLKNFIKKSALIRYRSADLFMKNVDDKVDITDMNIYSDNSFDVILCSHVLEHIVDDRKAMSELFRILKPDGFAIIMVPINLLLKEDFENSEYKTEAERWKYFGQNDHVRLYSKNGFVNKLTQTGFKVNQLGIDYFGKEVFEKNGIHPRSVLYVVEK
jgi:SAM-dependent methyltransferase